MSNCRHDLVAIILRRSINVVNWSPDAATSNQINCDVVSTSCAYWKAICFTVLKFLNLANTSYGLT